MFNRNFLHKNETTMGCVRESPQIKKKKKGGGGGGGGEKKKNQKKNPVRDVLEKLPR